jgi:hypothetical protein
MSILYFTGSVEFTAYGTPHYCEIHNFTFFDSENKDRTAAYTSAKSGAKLNKM